MAIYKGTSKLGGLYLGTKKLDKSYLGTKLVYNANEAPAEQPVLFDGGLIDGISWQANALPRPQYNSIAYASVEAATLNLWVVSASSYSSVNHNCHVVTGGLITVPANATVMKVRAIASSGQGGVYPYLIIGLLTDDAVNSMDATNGGQLSSALLANAQTYTEYSLTLANGIAGNSWRAIVNMRRNARASGQCTIMVNKVWFE